MLHRSIKTQELVLAKAPIKKPSARSAPAIRKVDAQDAGNCGASWRGGAEAGRMAGLRCGQDSEEVSENYRADEDGSGRCASCSAQGGKAGQAGRRHAEGTHTEDNPNPRARFWPVSRQGRKERHIAHDRRTRNRQGLCRGRQDQVPVRFHRCQRQGQGCAREVEQGHRRTRRALPRAITRPWWNRRRSPPRASRR